MRQPAIPPPMPGPSETSIPYSGPEGNWVYNPQTQEVWRVGREGGIHAPGTDQPGVKGNISQVPPPMQKYFRDQADMLNRLLHPEPPSFEFPEIKMPEFNFPETKFPDLSQQATEQRTQEELGASQARTAKAESLRRGRRRSILTGPRGLITPAPTRRKVLLGE